MRGVRWFAAAVVLAVAFPAAAVVAGIAYLVLRRRWPDRTVAVVVAVLTLAAAAGAFLTLDYWGSWLAVAVDMSRLGPPATTGDWATVAGTGIAMGPTIGAVVWLITQRVRERSPYSGADETERRRSAEEHRRLLLTHAAQRTRHIGPRPLAVLARPLAVDLGDEVGPVLGRFQRGDLPPPWRHQRRVRLPMAHPNNRHLLILGATGLGKTETALAVAEWGARHGRQILYLTCKEPPSARRSVAPRLAAIAAGNGLTFRALTPVVAPYDPMRGDLAEVRDRLIRIEEWGDRYWAAVANTLVAVALELNAEQGHAIDALPDLVYSLVRGRLASLAKRSADPRIGELIDAFNYNDLGGALMRYASMAVHLRGWIGPAKAGGWALEDADVACIELPTVSRPEAATALMRLMLRDFGSYLVDPARRQTTPGGRPKPVLAIIEEAGAVAGDPVIGREFVNQVERNRDAGAYSVLTAQDPAGFGGGRTWSALATNAVVLSYRQVQQAEAIAGLAGTERVTEAGADYDTDGTVTHQGVARRQYAFKVNPQLLRQLGLGEFVVISAGRYAKVAATMPHLSYRLPEIPAVWHAYDALNQARLAAAAPATHPEKTSVSDLPTTHGRIIF